MTARLGRELVLHGGPSLGIDQSGMLSGITLTPVGDLPEVDRVREQPVDVPAREQFATALTSVRRRAALGLEPELVSRLLDTPHATKLAIEHEDAAHGLGCGWVDDQCSPARVVAERHVATHPEALL